MGHFLTLIQRDGPLIGLRLISDGRDFPAIDPILGMGAKKIDVAVQVVFLPGHFLQKSDSCPGIVHSPVAVDRFIFQVVGFNGIAELMGIVPAVFVNRKSVQEAGEPQNLGITALFQEPVEKVQVELGIIGHQQGPLCAFEQMAEGSSGFFFADALLSAGLLLYF